MAKLAGQMRERLATYSTLGKEGFEQVRGSSCGNSCQLACSAGLFWQALRRGRQCFAVFHPVGPFKLIA